MQQQEVKVLLGSMDKENSPESMNLYDYIEAHNIRTVGNDESDANYLTNLEGTKLITVNLPLGQNRCIGAKGFESVSKAYFVRFNSMGYHQIVEFDFNTDIETVIFENLTDSNNIDLLNISVNSYFTDIRLLHERFLILNNGETPILFLDVRYFKSTTGTVRTLEDILLARKAPLTPIALEYGSDPTKTTNALRGELFQFRYRYKYKDYSTSSWSTVSKREVPINEPADGYGQNVGANNVLIGYLDTGSDKVDSVEIAVRSGFGNWLLVKEVKRGYLENLSSSPIDIGIVNENFVGGVYGFTFYNEGLYPVLDQTEVENAYNAIPHKAETVEIINGNILSVGGITEGYDRLTIDEVSIEGLQYEPNIQATSPSGEGSFDIQSREVILSGALPYVEWTFEGEPKQGDQIIMQHRSSSSDPWTQTEYTVTALNETQGVVSTITASASLFNTASSNFTVSSVTGQPKLRILLLTANLNQVQFLIRRVNIGSISTQSINTLKTNSSYQVALAYYDEYDRRFPIVTDDRFIVDTPSLAETQGLLTQISWNIQEEAPEGAVSYQWLISENQKYQNSIYLTGELSSEDGKYIKIDVKSLERFLESEKDSQVNYTFTKGDRVVFLYHTASGTSGGEQWFRRPFIELDIVDFSIEQDPSVPTDITYMLTVRYTPLLEQLGSLSYLNDRNIMMELYTPKKRSVDNTDSMIYYEVGEQYDIIDGKHSVTAGTIRQGDWFYRGRIYEDVTDPNTGLTFLVEDPNFSDNYESRYWSAGRARTYNDEVGRVERQGSIRYSDEYVYGTQYNGINTFFLERIYGEGGGETTSKYGWIRKLESRDNGLVCIQEFKTSIIPVYKTIVYDNTDVSLVADSGKIFGHAQYRVGNYGCGNAKESIAVSRNSLIYFFDDNNCLPIRDSYSGLDVIDAKMTSYFIKYAKEAKNRGAKFIGYYDNLNEEYNLSIEDTTGRLVSINFEDVVYRDTFNVPSETLTLIQPSNGTATINNYDITYTPDNDYVGDDRVEVEFTIGGEAYTRGVNISVIAEDVTPEPFTFTPQTNVALSSVVQSNIITVSGVNTATPISIVGGEYQINGGTWTTVADTVSEGDAVRVRHTASGSLDTTTTTTLTVGTYTTTFESTTQEMVGNPVVSIIGEVEDVGGFYQMKIKTSEILPLDLRIQCYVVYRQFGSEFNTVPLNLIIPSGTLESPNVQMIESYGIEVMHGVLDRTTADPYKHNQTYFISGQDKTFNIFPFAFVISP